jgi:putative peptidoglycan lipid II flippase
MSTSFGSLARYSAIVVAGFVVSRFFGLFRNMAILDQFGAGRDYEAFLAAIAIPDLVFQVLAGGAVGSAFIPVFNGYFARGEESQAWRLTSSVITIALAVTAPVALVLALLARPLADLLVPGWDPESKALTAELMRIMLISPVIFAVSGFVTSVLNSFQRFAAAALAPIFYNLAIIAGALLARPLDLGIHAVAIGATVGAGLHLLVQLPGLLQQGYRFRPTVDLALAGVREVGRLMLPRMLGLGVVQLNLLVNVVLASFLLVGSVGFLNVAWLMIMSPLVLAMAVSTAVFPTLAAESALDRHDEVRRLFLLSLRLIVFLTVPASIGLIALGEPIIRLFFERGEFTSESTRMTAYALKFYALGLLGHATVEIVDRVFYAFHDTWSPVRVATGAILTNILLSLALMNTPLNYGGLALANAIAATLEGGTLIWLLSRKLRDDSGRGLGLMRFGDDLGRILAAALLMGLVTVLLSELLFQRIQFTAALEHAAVLSICILAGAATYFGLASLFRVEETVTLWRLFRDRRGYK